jgi:hypothetical protein
MWPTIVQPRTTGVLTQDLTQWPKFHSKPQAERDWISELAQEEAYIRDTAAFHQMSDI